MYGSNGAVIVKLQGGLGNQLFQYAYGLSLSNALSRKCLLDTRLLEINRLGITKRNYDLYPYKISANKLGCIRSAELGVIQSPRITSIISRLGIKIRGNIYISESSFPNIDMFNIPSSCGIVLDGYWQSEKYFNNVSDIVKRNINSYEYSSLEAIRLQNIIQSSESVGIHIRRGDYVSSPSAKEFHGVCSIKYYEDAIEYIVANVSMPAFFVFTDDPEWARENLSTKHHLTIVSCSEELTHHDELCLMARCSHNIIANSSFSWWAAWLNQNPRRIIVAPKKWYKGRETPHDLIPKEWNVF